MSDWQAVADEETGETYYHNVVTDETQWEMPDALLNRAAGKTPPQAYIPITDATNVPQTR